MRERFLQSMILSFIAFWALSFSLVRLYNLFTGNPSYIALLIFGYLIPFTIVVIFGFIKHRDHKTRLLAVIGGPVTISLFILLILVFMFLLALPSLF